MPKGVMADHDQIEAERGAHGAALAPGESDIAAEQRQASFTALAPWRARAPW